jgi:demethylmenaquinone methyltransferase/2-methoxy-6-polyprenyl-1,4-benzoquinol methylase
MFDRIAPRYDLLNSVLSAGIHHSWRTFATRCAALKPGDSVLDVCTGTGDWAVLARRAVGPSGRVVGLDFSLPMMRSGDAKFQNADVARTQADASRLPFQRETFDAVTVAFGIRNVAETDRAFREIARVLKPGGRLVCLEFSEPKQGALRLLYKMYSRAVLPRIGNLISGSSEAYTYLPESVARFRSREDLAGDMRRAGFSDVRYVDLTLGIVCVHVAVKDGPVCVSADESKGDGRS